MKISTVTTKTFEMQIRRLKREQDAQNSNFIILKNSMFRFQLLYDTYLFPLSFSVANAFKLLNEDPGGSEKILLWLKSKWRNLTSFSTTSGTWINSFHDKLMVSRVLWSNPSRASDLNVWSPLILLKLKFRI